LPVKRLLDLLQQGGLHAVREWTEDARFREILQGTAETTNFEEFRIDKPFSSLLSTTRDVLLSPRRFFDEMPPDVPLGATVLYFLICFAITTAINLIASLAVFAVPLVLALPSGSSEARPVIVVALLFALGFLVVLPILSVVIFFVLIPIQHVFVRLVAGRNQRGLPATLRASCYSVGAPVMVAWVPMVGFLAVFYCFYLYTAGLKRVHGISTGRTLAAILILAALSLIITVGGTVYGYNLVWAATERPVSYYFPEPETSANLPPGIVGATALMDGSEDQARVRRLRDASYSDEPPPERYHTEVSIDTADPKGYPRGVRGFVREAGGGVVKIERNNSKESTPETENILYYASEDRVSSAPGFYETPVVQQALHQEFMLRGGGCYTIELEQVGKEPVPSR
jgi:hypothetical protein